MITRIRRLFAYLREGSICSFLAWLWLRRKRKIDINARPKRIANWKTQASNQGYLDVELQRNVRIFLYFDSELSRQIYLNAFEWRERRFVNAFLERGDIFVDVGANIGLFTVIGSHCVGKTGHVFAFEPTSLSFQRLVRNIELGNNDNVTALQVALSDRTHQAKLTVSLDGYDAWNSLTSPTAGNNFSEELVECDTWDSFARNNGLVDNVNLIKIDVEGWENRVLSGASECLSRDDAPVLLVEFTDDNAKRAGTSCKELFLHLESLGFEIFEYDAVYNRLLPEPMREHYSYSNLIACKNAERVSLKLSKHAKILM
jgi:FkbM family methyltransferase